MSQGFGKPATWVKPFDIGGYYNLYKKKIEVVDDCVFLRLPQSNIIMFPDEKIRAETAIARFSKHNTQIPVSRVLSSSLDIDIWLL